MPGLANSTRAAALAVAVGLATATVAGAEVADWPYTEGLAGGGRYSPLADIDRTNVADLEVAWTYRHGDVDDGGLLPDKVFRGTAFEGTPVVAGGRLIFTTPFNRVIALDPERGTELWTYDPRIDRKRRYANMIIHRGVALWNDTAEPADGGATDGGGPCRERVLFGTLDARLIAIDAVTGLPCDDFGDGGQVNLLVGLDGVADAWEYNVTSPPAVVGDVVVVGSSIADTLRAVAPPGDVRGFDVRSGKLLWTFRTVPAAGEAGAFARVGRPGVGAANVWSTMTVDAARGLVFLPVSTPSPDFFGGDRPGANLYSDSVVAHDGSTGRPVWHFQTVHHDLWDYDLAAPPLLATRRGPEGPQDVVVQATKTGFVFVLDRETGKPVFEVVERPVPASDLPDERAWPTQPVPVRPPPLLPERLGDDDLWDVDGERLAKCRALLSGLRNEGRFTPPSTDGTLLYPSTGGGVNWSGLGYEPPSRRVIVPVNNVAHVLRLQRLADRNAGTASGQPLRNGLSGIWWLLTGRGTGLRYWTNPVRGRRNFAVDGVPCNEPPWGLLVAIDLDSGDPVWKAPLGRDADGVRGQFSYGPLLVTGGGLVFAAGTREPRLYVHDVENGREIASFELPAGLHAGPVSYRTRADGPQYLVVAPGGHVGMGSPLGDWVQAYRLPDGRHKGANR